MWIWFASCSLFEGASVIDTPPAAIPSRPAAHKTGVITLGRSTVSGTFTLPPSSRPNGEAAPARFSLQGPLELVESRKREDIYRAPLPVLDNLLPSESSGTHIFGSEEPPGFVVSGPSGKLLFERGGHDPYSYGFDREWLYIGWKKGEPAPKPAAFTIGFEKATAMENSLNLATSNLSTEDFARRTLTVGTESWSGLYLPPPAEASFEIVLPPAAKLSFDARILTPAIVGGRSSDGADVQVLIRAPGQSETVVEQVHVSPDRSQHVEIDLSAYTGAATLLLRTAPGPASDSTFDYLLLVAPAITVSRPDPERIILVFIDTLRADHLSFMGYERPTSPVLDRLAAHAAVFEQARTVAPWTLPSARALLTGRQPEAWFESQTLAEALGEAGWRTEAIVSNAFLSQPFDMQRGWDHFSYKQLLPADELVQQASAAISSNVDRDLLLLVHFMDPHLPYDEPFFYRKTFTRKAPDSLKYLNRHELNELDPNHPDYQATIDYVTGRYDQNILFVDHELRTLFNAAGPRATIVVFSDHGEELWDHGGYEHGHSFYDELLHVPLVIRSPYVTPGRYDTPVSLLDISPTVREIAGVEQIVDIPGRSLVGLTFGDEALREELRQRPLAFGRPLYGTDGWGVVTDGHKWWDRAGVQALFALSDDPHEQDDIAPDQSELERWPVALEAALSREVEHVWRIDLTGEGWRYDLDLTVSHPEGFSRVWLGYDPRGRGSTNSPVLTDGIMTLKINKGQPVPPSIYLVPNGDPYDPKGLAMTLVGRGVMLGVTATRGRLSTGYDPQTIVATGDERFHLLADLAWVPEPSGVEVSGFHPDMAGQLRELGYLEEEENPPHKEGSP